MMRLKRTVVLIFTVLFITACGKNSENESQQSSVPTEEQEYDNPALNAEEQEEEQQTFDAEVQKEEHQAYSTEDIAFVQSIYDELYLKFKEFNRLTVTNNGNWEEEILDENGNIYFRLEEENYQNTDDVRELLQQTFSHQYTKDHLQWVLNEEYPMFKEIEGSLCIAGMLENIVLPMGDKVCSIESMGDREIVFITEYIDEKFQESATHRIVFVIEDGKWVFDDCQELDNS